MERKYPSFAECIASFKAVDKRAMSLCVTTKKVPDMNVIEKIKRILNRHWESEEFKKKCIRDNA